MQIKVCKGKGFKFLMLDAESLTKENYIVNHAKENCSQTRLNLIKLLFALEL